MLYSIIAQLYSVLLARFVGGRNFERRKDLEILILRQQLQIMQRQHPQMPKVSRWNKLALAVLAHQLASVK